MDNLGQVDQSRTNPFFTRIEWNRRKRMNLAKWRDSYSASIMVRSLRMRPKPTLHILNLSCERIKY